MLPRLIRSVLLALPLFWLTGCADQVVTIRYASDPTIPKLVTAQTLTVFRFVDARGDEGDHGDPTRVGGTYGGYGNRLSKVKASTPWPEALVKGLADGLAQRGEDGAVGLTGDAAGFELEGLSAKLGFYGLDIEHCVSFTPAAGCGGDSRADKAGLRAVRGLDRPKGQPPNCGRPRNAKGAGRRPCGYLRRPSLPMRSV